MDFGRVGKHLTYLRVDVLPKFNIGRQDTAQHGCDFTDDRLRLDRVPRLRRGLAKAQNLQDQVFGAACRTNHLLQICPLFAAVGEAAACQVGVENDGGEDIVEIVSNSSG